MVYKVYVIFVNLKHDLLRCVCVCVDLHSMICCWKFGGFLSKHKLPCQSLIIGRHLRELFDVGGFGMHFDLSTEEVRRGPFGMFFQPSRRLHSSLVLQLCLE